MKINEDGKRKDNDMTDDAIKLLSFSSLSSLSHTLFFPRKKKKKLKALFILKRVSKSCDLERGKLFFCMYERHLQKNYI